MPAMPELPDLCATLARRVNADPWLLNRGRFVDAVVLLEAGDTSYLIDIRRGRIESVTRGPFVMPRWDFALRASADEWRAFWQPSPPPGHHDLFALIKRRTLRVEGDLHPFMSNLFYFKGVLAAPRADAH